jgi:hypothetical protein
MLTFSTSILTRHPNLFRAYPKNPKKAIITMSS